MKKRWKLASALSTLAIAAGAVAIATPANAAAPTASYCTSIGTSITWKASSPPAGPQSNLCLVNNQYLAIFQLDSNFVVYKSVTDVTVVDTWQSGTSSLGTGRPLWLFLQGDGNIVAYDSPTPSTGAHAYWWANNGNNHYQGYSLQMQSDGNLVEYGYPNLGNTSVRTVLWATYTS